MGMGNVPFQKDLKIDIANNMLEKATLSLSPTGDIQLIEGREKLVAQLMRAIVNDDTALTDMINDTSITTRRVNTLFNLVLRAFRQTQIDEVKKSDPNFSGFKFYRKAINSNEDYAQASADPIVYKFVDSGLTNGTEYEYGIARIYQSIYESEFVDKFTLSPTRFTHNQKVEIGDFVVAVPGNEQITFYVDYNKKFKTSEILDEILSIDVLQDQQEPRRYTVNIVIKDLKGNKQTIATQRLDVTK